MQNRSGSISRRGFIALASGLLVPAPERVRAYSFMPNAVERTLVWGIYLSSVLDDHGPYPAIFLPDEEFEDRSSYMEAQRKLAPHTKDRMGFVLREHLREGFVSNERALLLG